MPRRALDCRIFFNDTGNAQAAYDYLVAIMAHAAAHDIQVGLVPQYSWARLHDCYAEEDDSDTERCVTVAIHRRGAPESVEIRDWEPGHVYTLGQRTRYDDIAYRCLQPSHTTQEGWEPPNVPAIWEPV